MYVGTGSMFVLCTQHLLTCSCQTFNQEIGVFTFHSLMYFNKRKKYIIHKNKIFINTVISTQMYINTIVFKYCLTLFTDK